MKTRTPDHLGGHANVTHVDTGALELFWELGARRLVDLGCGPGGQVQEAKSIGYTTWGIDGDPNLRNVDELCDFTQATSRVSFSDTTLVWCVEFVEHVEEQHAHNFTGVLKAGQWVVLTHATPGTDGHHHVNCQREEYWKGFMAACGLVRDAQLTALLKDRSTMEREFIQKTGSVYTRP